jgi:hypothetical protein
VLILILSRAVFQAPLPVPATAVKVITAVIGLAATVLTALAAYWKLKYK